LGETGDALEYKPAAEEWIIKMSILSWNHKKVQNLKPWAIWFFIIGRVLLGFGLGVLAMQNYPKMFGWTGLPLCGLGAFFLLAAAKGLARKSPESN
jgi:hypothetical protein